MCIVQGFYRDDLAIRQSEAIKLSQIKYTFPVTGRVERSFWSALKAALSYVGKLEIHYDVSFSEAIIKYIVAVRFGVVKFIVPLVRRAPRSDGDECQSMVTEVVAE